MAKTVALASRPQAAPLQLQLMAPPSGQDLLCSVNGAEDLRGDLQVMMRGMATMMATAMGHQVQMVNQQLSTLNTAIMEQREDIKDIALVSAKTAETTKGLAQ